MKALIFDVDGTLADTEEAHRRAFNSAFQQFGLAWHWSKPQYAHLLLTTGGKERLNAYLESLPLGAAERAALRGRVPDLHRTKNELYTQMVQGGEVPLRDGVARLLDEARDQRVPVAIASTTSFVNIEVLLSVNLGADALGRFAVIGAGDDARLKKPAPDIYEYVLRKLELSADECVAFEDSANGLKAAKAAGLYTIVTPSFWTRSEDFSTADLVLPSLGSGERPLSARAASLAGNSVLGLREIHRHLNKYEKCG